MLHHNTKDTGSATRECVRHRPSKHPVQAGDGMADLSGVEELALHIGISVSHCRDGLCLGDLQILQLDISRQPSHFAIPIPCNKHCNQ